jgi:hypothetical protein
LKKIVDGFGGTSLESAIKKGGKRHGNEESLDCEEVVRQEDDRKEERREEEVIPL